jgi:hypothetical protein
MFSDPSEINVADVRRMSAGLPETRPDEAVMFPLQNPGFIATTLLDDLDLNISLNLR